MISRVFQ